MHLHAQERFLDCCDTLVYRWVEGPVEVSTGRKDRSGTKERTPGEENHVDASPLRGVHVDPRSPNVLATELSHVFCDWSFAPGRKCSKQLIHSIEF